MLQKHHDFVNNVSVGKGYFDTAVLCHHQCKINNSISTDIADLFLLFLFPFQVPTGEISLSEH